MASGTYTFSNVPSAHPITLNNSKETLINIQVLLLVELKQSRRKYLSYYYGDVTVTVNGDFGTISYECFNHGYMGGQNNLVYNASCSVTPTPTPTPVAGNLTVDATDIYADNALITADQTDE